MDIYLTVDTYFEYFLTILGWIISNNLWSLLTNTGLFVLPFLFHIIGHFLKVREEGDDEGNKGRLLINKLENTIYISLFVMMITCAPLFSVSYNTLELNQERMKECGHAVLKPSETGLSRFSSELNGQSASLPLWWAFVYTIGKGFTHGSIAAIPCDTDLRQIRFDIQNTQITSPTLRREVGEFYQMCYAKARSKIMRKQVELDEEQARDIDWIGSTIMLTTPGLYDTYRSALPRELFPYNASRDAGRLSPQFSQGKGGFPTCREWWLENNVGLRKRLLEQVEPDIWTKLSRIWNNKQEYEDVVIRRLVTPENIEVSSGRNIYGGYGASNHLANAGSTVGVNDYINMGTTAVSGLSSTIGNFLSKPIFDSIKQSLPMIQGFLLLAIAIGIPVIMVFSGYSIKGMVIITFVQVSIFFLSFWWELARWLDNKLIDALYSSDTHSRWNLYGVLNTADDMISAIMVNTLYLVLPTIWLAMLGWAGVKAGIGIGNVIDKSSNTVEKTTKQGKDAINSVATNVASK